MHTHYETKMCSNRSGLGHSAYVVAWQLWKAVGNHYHKHSMLRIPRTIYVHC